MQTQRATGKNVEFQGLILQGRKLFFKDKRAMCWENAVGKPPILSI